MVAEMHSSNTLLAPGRPRIQAERVEARSWMRGASILLMLVLTLAVAIAGSAVFSRSDLPAASPGFAEDRAAVDSFYSAFDRALAGESTDPLAALLAPGFLDHDASLGDARSADEFLAQIGALGQVGGGRLTVDSISASGQSLIAEIRQAPAGPRAFAGVSIEQQGEQPITEVLRVAQGRIIDRWTPGSWWLDTSELSGAAWMGTGSAGYASTLVRAFIPATAQHHWAATGPGFLVIESGSARMQVTRSVGKDETLPLEPGAGIALAAGDHVNLRSADDEPVTVLIYTVVRQAGADFLLSAGAANAQKSGVTQSILWNGSMAYFDTSTVHRLGTLELPAGKDVRLTETSGALLLMSVDSGAIELDAEDGVISMLDTDLQPVGHVGVAGVEGERAASVREASAITLHNGSDRPVTVTVIVAERSEPGGPVVG